MHGWKNSYGFEQDEYFLLIVEPNVIPESVEEPPKFVKLFNVPSEIEMEDVVMVMSQYGDVKGYKEMRYRDIPTVKTGHRRVIVKMNKQIRNFVKIRGYNIPFMMASNKLVFDVRRPVILSRIVQM